MKVSSLEILLHKKLTDQLTADEERQLDILLASDNMAEDQVTDIWNTSKDFIPKVNFAVAPAFESLMDRIDKETSSTTSDITHTVKNAAPQGEAKVFSLFSRRNMLRIAAIFVLGLASMGILQNTLSSSFEGGDSGSYAQLSDGSSVWLAPDAELEFSTFLSSKRNVTLQGVAFFDVKRDEARPFVINANDLKVSVLGTAFTIDSEKKSVAVNSGKVKVDDGRSDIILIKGQKVSVATEGMQVAEVSYEDFKWINETLSFDNTPLDQVIKELSAYYMVNISYKGRTDLTKCPFTATNLKGVNLSQVIRILKATYEMDVKKDESGKNIVFSKVRCR